MINYTFFSPNTVYRLGDRVLNYTQDYTQVCLWECIASEYVGDTLIPYSYTPRRNKIYYWKQLCCEDSTLVHPSNLYYGDCAIGIPRWVDENFYSRQILKYTEVFDDFYENGVFI